MTANARRWLLIAGALSLPLIPVIAYGLDTALRSDEVARNVAAAGVQLGGLGVEDALTAVRDHERQLVEVPAFFSVNGEEFALNPVDVALGIDKESVISHAMEQRRERGLIGGFFEWLGSFGGHIEVDVPVTFEPERLEAILDDWEAEAIASPAYDGGIIVADGSVLPDYPRSGEGIDRAVAEQVVQSVLEQPVRAVGVLPTSRIQPVLTKSDIDEATAEASQLISAPITLHADDPMVDVTFTREDLAAALVAHVQTRPVTGLVLAFDEAYVASFLASYREMIEQPPRAAQFVIDEETEEVTLVPSRPATLVDAALVAEALLEAAYNPLNSGEFPLVLGREASFTTSDAQAMGDIQLVSEYSTSHPAGQPRVTNIHLIADTVDGAVVMPGEEFSVNEHVGRRTTEDGYVSAPMILAGEIVPSVGGGVSQFATTFYNAVFYGCYEDVDHKPHSYYFERYPEVNEATISWPTPNLVFRNNTDALVIVKTQYTATDITVQLYGNNGGCEVERILGERTAFTTPPEMYEADSTLTPGDEVVVQRSFGGFTNTVTRVMRWPDGKVIGEDYSWIYRPQSRIIRVHPCNVPPANPAQCPIVVPSVVGSSLDGATATLQAAGFTISQGATIEVEDKDQNGLIQSQSPPAGQWLPPGTTITVNVGVHVPAEEPPPDNG